MIKIDEDKPLTEGRFVEILNDRLGIKDDEDPVCLVLIEKHLLDSLKRSIRKGEKTRSITQEKRVEKEQTSPDVSSPKTTDSVPDEQQPDKQQSSPNRLIKLPEVMKRTGSARQTIYEMMRKGVFPQKQKRGRSTFWKESEIDQYVEGTWKPTDEADPKKSNE